MKHLSVIFKSIVFIGFIILLSSSQIVQEKKDFLFIGDSYFKNNNLISKFQDKYFFFTGDSATIDHSLINGNNCIRQVENNSKLKNMLIENSYKYVVLQCPSLLKPKVRERLSNTIRSIYKISSGTEKILLVPMDECTEFPKYSCTNIGEEMTCNVYNDCLEEQGMVEKVSLRLSSDIAGVRVIPFFEFKRIISSIEFSKMDDIYGHPSKEMQELLSWCIMTYIQSEKGLTKSDLRDRLSERENKYFTLNHSQLNLIFDYLVNCIIH